MLSKFIEYIIYLLLSFFNINSLNDFNREWPWVQSGSFVLHTISMLMKLHSYSFYNGELSVYAIRLSELKKQYSNLIGESKKTDNEIDEKKENEKQQVLDQLKEKIEQVEGYLHSPAGNICYPKNVTVLNYLDFLFVPTLVYELEYPRTEK